MKPAPSAQALHFKGRQLWGAMMQIRWEPMFRTLGLLALCLGLSVAGAAVSTEDPWSNAAHDDAGTFHSKLKDINVANVQSLGLAWDYRLGTHRGLEATPIVVDGVLYTSGNFGRVYALDAASGKERWQYDPDIDGQAARYACCDAVNRGVAFWKGRIYVASLDGYLHAINAANGKRIWKSDAIPARSPKAPYTLTGAPVIAGDTVLIGTGGGDFHGVRGYVEAFDLQTGALRWRFYTVPRDPKLGAQDQAHLVDAVKTWDPRHRWETGGGGAVWDGISYDPQLKLIFIGTGNASPYDLTEDGRTGGDSLYSDCILALNADTGKLVWHFQVVPGDKWDLDSTQKLVLADIDVDRQPRRVLMQASKNGYFYVLDRVTGEFISAKPFAFANWTLGLDAKSGRPALNPAADYSKSPKLIFPWEGGAHSWQAMSYDAQSGLVFIPVIEAGDIQIETAHLPVGLTEGQFTSPIMSIEDYDPQALASLYGPLPSLASITRGLPNASNRGVLRAWDALHQRLAWEVATPRYWNGGVLSTDGGLVIQGDLTGRINVYAAASGKLLKSVNVGSSIMATPMTYRVRGVQYIAVMAGYGGGELGVPLPEQSAAYRYGNEGRIIALKLDAPAPTLPEKVSLQPFPTPPADPGEPSHIAQGEILYGRFCARCHVLGRGILPDLRRLTPEKHQLFNDIVLKGILQPLGMGRFDDVLSTEEARAIHDYLIHEAWKAQSGHGNP
jgi:quinohemoprotein ethanol dehydrogenase